MRTEKDRYYISYILIVSGSDVFPLGIPASVTVIPIAATVSYRFVGTASTATRSGGRGRVTMPMQPAFWAKAWGMATDRFGTPWIVNGEMLAD